LTNEKIIDCVKKPQQEYEKINNILYNNEKNIPIEEDDEDILTRHLLDETI
jgi:hypothetical protein